jgi:hypothetical protein
MHDQGDEIAAVVYRRYARGPWRGVGAEGVGAGAGCRRRGRTAVQEVGDGPRAGPRGLLPISMFTSQEISSENTLCIEMRR